MNNKEPSKNNARSRARKIRSSAHSSSRISKSFTRGAYTASTGDTTSAKKMQEVLRNDKQSKPSSTSSEKTLVTEQSRESRKIMILQRSIVFLAAVLVVALLAAVVVYFVRENAAQERLDTASQSQGDIHPRNFTEVVYEGQAPESANSTQKALTTETSNEAPAYFSFWNGNDLDQETVSIFVDPGEQRSRDFFLSNATTLQSLVESGTIELQVHILLSGEAYSILAAESLAQTFAATPEKSWNLLISLLREAPTVGARDNLTDISAGLDNILKTSEITTVTSETIQEGKFASWLLSVGNDRRLEGEVLLPMVYVGDTHMPIEPENLNDPAQIRKQIIENL